MMKGYHLKPWVRQALQDLIIIGMGVICFIIFWGFYN